MIPLFFFGRPWDNSVILQVLKNNQKPEYPTTPCNHQELRSEVKQLLNEVNSLKQELKKLKDKSDS